MAGNPDSSTDGTNLQLPSGADPSLNDGGIDCDRLASEDAVAPKVTNAEGAPAAEAGHIGGTDADHAETDLLGAVISASDVVSSIDHTLDQLTTATDLFDVPALDFDDGLPT